MLQVSSGKFFKSEELYETVHRFVVYTNYRFYGRNAIDIGVGKVFPCWDSYESDVSKFVCEVTERIEKSQGGEGPGVLISTGGRELVNDLLMLMSFRFGAIFSLEYETARRMVLKTLPAQEGKKREDFLDRYFKPCIISNQKDVSNFRNFCKRLLGAERKIYEGLLRSIKQYVTAVYRSRDDLNGSYTLMVASIEALAQNFDEYESAWDDYDGKSKKEIDEALLAVDSDIADAIRAVIVKREHLSATRRFVEFSLSHIQDSYYRGDAENVIRPASKSDVKLAVKNAYSLRSRYIHQLESIPNRLHMQKDLQEIVLENGTAYFSMTGLARFSKHIIETFLSLQDSVEFESYDYMSNLPNTIKLTMAPRYWIGRAEGLSLENIYVYLSGHLDEYASHLMGGHSSFSQMTPVLDKIEVMVAGLSRPAQKVPFVALYLFYTALFSNLHDRGLAFLDKYARIQDVPAIENLLLHILFRENPPWPLGENISLMGSYLKSRRKEGELKLHSLLESVIYLWLVEQYFDVDRSQSLKLVCEAVENWPGNRNLENYEKLIQDGAEPIFWGYALGLEGLKG